MDLPRSDQEEFIHLVWLAFDDQINHADFGRLEELLLNERRLRQDFFALVDCEVALRSYYTAQDPC